MLSNWNVIFDHVDVFICFCLKTQETLKSTIKIKSLASCSRCGYKMKLNMSYAREIKKLKLGVWYHAPNYKNNQDSSITVKAWQQVNHIFLLLDFIL